MTPNWDEVLDALERGEDVEVQLDAIAGTGLKPRDEEAERQFEEEYRGRDD